MLHFESDYLEGAHPALLSKLLETNLEQAPGYGSDPWCESAREKIGAACGCAGATRFWSGAAPVHWGWRRSDWPRPWAAR